MPASKYGGRTRSNLLIVSGRSVPAPTALIIINDDGLYHLVSKEIAEKIALRDPRRIITSHSAEEEMDEAYKDFKVPDDLDW